MSRVSNDAAWKRRVLMEESVLERKNMASARRLGRSTAGSTRPSSAAMKADPKIQTDRLQQSVGSVTSHVSSQPKPAEPRVGPIPSYDAASVRVTSHASSQSRPRVGPIPSYDAVREHNSNRADREDDNVSISSYSSGTSIQSYPSSRLSAPSRTRSDTSFRTTSTALSKIERLERILEEERQKRIVAESEIQMLKKAILLK